jgi:hypothetical protein
MLQFLNHLLHSTDLFQCYCWQNYTTISKTDLCLSYFAPSYVFQGHNDSVTICSELTYTFDELVDHRDP